MTTDTTTKTKVRLAAVRAAVKNQVVSFKLAELQRHPFCHFSGKPVDGTNATVHHDPEISTMFRDFCTENGIDPGDLPHEHDAAGRPYFTDAVLVHAWQTYHALHARLFLVDRAAHAAHHGESPAGQGIKNVREKDLAWIEKVRVQRLADKYRGFNPTEGVEA